MVGLYKDRFRSLLPGRRESEFGGRRGLLLLGLTTLPALVCGAAAHGFIKQYLFNPVTVALGLGVGGVAILLIERLWVRPGRAGLGALQWRDALLVGLFQCLSLWPGVSRAAATIIGGRIAGLERRTATEYSFLAAVPVMFAAIGYDLLKSWRHLEFESLPIFAVGFVRRLVVGATGGQILPSPARQLHPGAVRLVSPRRSGRGPAAVALTLHPRRLAPYAFR